jgi:hypothetical protein
VSPDVTLNKVQLPAFIYALTWVHEDEVVENVAAGYWLVSEELVQKPLVAHVCALAFKPKIASKAKVVIIFFIEIGFVL